MPHPAGFFEFDGWNSCADSKFQVSYQRTQNFRLYILAKMEDIKPSTVCRCCLSADVPVFQMLDVIFNSTGPEHEMITALEIYFDFTALNISMVLDSSLQICLNCQSQLQTVFSFRKQCLESHDFLLRVKEGKSGVHRES
jgi:Zinc-finger associated domain (zf-AD)